MNKEILRLALPNIISNITVPLLGLVDMAIVGHLESAGYIGGIVIATTIINFIYWNFSFLRMGTSGFTAQQFGANDAKGVVETLQRALSVSVIIGVLIIVIQALVLRLGFLFMEPGEEVARHASDYFHIYVWAAPAVLSMYAFNGWFVGVQDAKTPMTIAIMINVVNIMLSLFLVFVCHMSIKGVALASLIAQYSGVLASLCVWQRKYGMLRKYLCWRVLTDKAAYRPFFTVNANIFVRSLALVITTTYFVSASSREGEQILSVNALIMQLFTFFSYLMDGFAYAAEALTGRFVGARMFDRLHQLVRRLFEWGVGIALVFSLAYTFFFRQILSLLTDKQEIISLALEFRLWASLIPFAGFAAFLWDGIFVGATASRQMRNSMLVAVGSFFLIYTGCRYMLPEYFVFHFNTVLWSAFLFYLFMRGMVQTLMARSVLHPDRLLRMKY